LGDRYHEFTYEEMCADTRGVLAAAFDFAGLPVAEYDLGGIPEHLQNMNERSIRSLDAHQISTIERIQGDLLLDLGYKLS
ncbi:MAG: hypothetical protein ACRELU_09575, partial [Gemmatimonadota bacterium]